MHTVSTGTEQPGHLSDISSTVSSAGVPEQLLRRIDYVSY